MGSSQIDPPRNSSTRGCSKAQNSLLNILRIISTVPPPKKGTPESEHDGKRKREVMVFGVDLNVPPEVKAESEAPVEAVVGNGGAAAGFGGGGGEVETETEKLSERSELSDNKGGGEEGFMGLLIDAARVIFGEFNDANYIADPKPEPEPEKNSSESQNSDKTKITVVYSSAASPQLNGNAEEEEPNSSAEASPVKRSKRGRIQTLPGKYRDSVLEPLTRFARTRSTTILANRRRSS